MVVLYNNLKIIIAMDLNALNKFQDHLVHHTLSEPQDDNAKVT